MGTWRRGLTEASPNSQRDGKSWFTNLNAPNVLPPGRRSKLCLRRCRALSAQRYSSRAPQGTVQCFQSLKLRRSGPTQGQEGPPQTREPTWRPRRHHTPVLTENLLIHMPPLTLPAQGDSISFKQLAINLTGSTCAT